MSESQMSVREAVEVLSKALEIHPFQQSDEGFAESMREMFLRIPELLEKEESIRGILWDYHRALDTRQHAGIAAGVLIHELEMLLETPWVRGKTAHERPGSGLNPCGQERMLASSAEGDCNSLREDEK